MSMEALKTEHSGCAADEDKQAAAIQNGLQELKAKLLSAFSLLDRVEEDIIAAYEARADSGEILAVLKEAGFSGDLSVLERWRKSKGKRTLSPKKALNAEDERFARHVLANQGFYSQPRSCEEILKRGWHTSKSPRELCAWLKEEGFEPIKKGHHAIKFILGQLQPWRSLIDWKAWE